MPLSTIHLSEILKELEMIENQAKAESNIERIDELVQIKATLLIATVLHDINENLIELGNLFENTAN